MTLGVKSGRHFFEKYFFRCDPRGNDILLMVMIIEETEYLKLRFGSAVPARILMKPQTKLIAVNDC